MHTALATLIMQAYQTQAISRYDIALALDVTPVSVSKWLRSQGDNPVPWKHYPALAHVLRLPLARILSAARQDHPHHVREFERFVSSLRKVGLTGQSSRRAPRR